MSPSARGRSWPTLLLALALSAGPFVSACSPPDPGGARSVEVTVPEGAGAVVVGRRLESAGLVRFPRVFALYAAVSGSEGKLKAGRYRFREDAGWGRILAAIRAGAVVTRPVTVPEGFSLREIAPRVARISGVAVDSVLSVARDTALPRRLGVPGPTLEGYLYPETYRFAEGVAPLEVLRAMVARYRSFWGPEERRRLASRELSEREVVTLASIVEEEATLPEERPVIAGVYLNRLDRGMRLQADPTVQYALEEPTDRLLYRHIRQVADDPYNTYTHPGLPPGPIASPGEGALRATLWPAAVPYLYFVARPDGSHVFSTTKKAHDRARIRIRRQREQAVRQGGDAASGGGP